MSSTNSVRSTWLRRASLLALLVPATALGAVPGTFGQRGDLEQAWFRMSEALESLDGAELRDRTDEILQVARRFQLRRLTPYSVALVVRARNLQPTGARALLEQAVRLDPRGPEAWLALATARWQDGAPFGGVAAAARGVLAFAADSRLPGFFGPSLLIAVLPVFLIAVAIWALFAIRLGFARLWHDLAETGSLLRLGVNAPVFAVVLLALPLFAAGDLVWLTVWIFALSWAYLTTPQKLGGAIALLVAGATPWLLEYSFRSLTHPPSAVVRAASALEERRYAPHMLEELAALDGVFGDRSEYYLLLGDCHRQYGLLDAAAWAYREGLRLEPDSGRLALALGTIDYMQGDFNAALQAFDAARETGVDPVIANYDLSLTLSQTYHFRESEEAMARARAANPERLQRLTSGRDQQQLIVPRFTVEEAERLLSQEDPIELLNRGLLPAPLPRERTVLHPLTIASLLALVVAIGNFLVRERTGGLAGACIKCGRAFCRRCKLSQESQSYCTQCVNIFLRKDMVAIEAQVTKRKQVARYQHFRLIERRFWDLLVPGIGVGGAGRPVLGFTLSMAAVAGTALAVFWFPLYLSPMLLGVSLVPFQLIAAASWLVALLTAQVVTLERR